MKIGPVDPEIALLNFKKERKKLTQAKYIARWASLPSGLNKLSLTDTVSQHAEHRASWLIVYARDVKDGKGQCTN